VNLNSVLVPVIVILVVLLIALIGAWVFFVLGSKGKGEAERKWTDPKFHD
jgi:membrane protein DedA with SNARE-associated domain